MMDVWSEIQRNTAKYSKNPYSPPYSNTAARRLMSQAITLAERQRRLQIRLTSPIPDRYQGHGCVVDLVRGHEAAIRLVDASNYVCHCCPAPLHNNGMFKSGPAFCNVLRHVSTKQHSSCVAQWVRAARVQYLLRRLRLFAWVAGRALQWHARAVERAYAPGGRGFNEAQTNFHLHASSCV